MLRSTRFLITLFLLISSIWWVQASAQTISWSKDEGPYSGAIALLTVDAAGDIFAATNSFGIYRSTDGGGSWQAAAALGLQYESVLVADSSDNIYTGNISSGLYASTDKGNSWSKTNLTGDVQCAAAISGNRICVGGRQTVSISGDLGKTWSASQVTIENVEVLSLAQDNLGNIYAGLQAYVPRPPTPSYGGGIYVSSDNGSTWGYDGMSLTPIYSMAVSKEGKVFILSISEAHPRGIVYSAALKNNNWKEDDAGILSGPYGVDSIITIFSDNIGEAVAVTNMGIFVYRDSTASWRSASSYVSLASITSAYYNPNGISYLGTDWNGIFLMEDSLSTWIQCGIDPRPVTAIGFDGSDNLFAGTEDGVFEQGPDGWRRVSDGLTHSTVYQIYYSASSKRLYASTAGGASYLPDKGNYWIPVTEEWTYDFVESPDSTKYMGDQRRDSHVDRRGRSLDYHTYDRSP